MTDEEPGKYEAFSDESDVEDAPPKRDFSQGDVAGLSHVTSAAYEVLSSQHAKYEGVCWNITSGVVVGDIAQTPPRRFWEQRIDASIGYTHSDEFARRLGKMMASGTRFVDLASLATSDGKFLEAMRGAIRSLHESGRHVTVRILTGNIIGVPTDNMEFMRVLTLELPKQSNLKLWVSSWRKGLSWNHAKIVAVDGRQLLTGGHNLWDDHYLQVNPVRDVSFECQGMVARDGHAFLNRMWRYVEKRDRRLKSSFGILGFKPLIFRANVSVASWPPGLPDYPPQYEESTPHVPLPEAMRQGAVRMFSMGRFGSLHHDKNTANPSDNAIVAMLSSAKKTLKLTLQDLGPLAIMMPGHHPLAIPGLGWPHNYLHALGKVIYERGVQVHLVLSHPNSHPGLGNGSFNNYGNGWTCADVASEIVKQIKWDYPETDEERLGGLVRVNLKLAYLRTSGGDSDWLQNQWQAGNHSKVFIVDDIAYYIGSQNLYTGNLAEWGVVVDDEAQTRALLEELWNPEWRRAYEDVDPAQRDLDIVKVLEGCGIDRTAPPEEDMTDEMWEQVLLRKQAAGVSGTERKLCLWLKSAEGVQDLDRFRFDGSSDAYVRMRLVDKDGNPVSVTQESRVDWDGGATPVWNQLFEFEGLLKPLEYKLRVTLMDHDSWLGLRWHITDWLASEDTFGVATFDLCDLVNSKCWQHKELAFGRSTLKVAFNTDGRWGNKGEIKDEDAGGKAEPGRNEGLPARACSCMRSCFRAPARDSH